jgi:hypothetical protein
MDQPRVDVSGQKRRQSIPWISHDALAQFITVIVTPQEHTALAKAVDLHTISQITQIWSQRLQLISVYVSFQICFAT